MEVRRMFLVLYVPDLSPREEKKFESSQCANRFNARRNNVSGLRLSHFYRFDCNCISFSANARFVPLFVCYSHKGTRHIHKESIK